MPTDERVEMFKKHFSFWEKLTDPQKELLFNYTSDTVYDKGINIHGNNGECTGAILIRSGQLRAYMLSEEGREITLYRLYPGEICMLSASCVLKTITFDVYIDAEEKSEVSIINANIFSTLVTQNIHVENFALKLATERFSDVMWAMQQILFMSFDRRLAVFLLDETAKNDDDTIKLTHEQIAKYMGSAREVVSRMLKYFSSEGLVEYSRSGIKVLDKKQLRKMINTSHSGVEST
ncbi:MAG: Crp/Fnr family transcriptional regulator [Eubacteriales bacterium]